MVKYWKIIAIAVIILIIFLPAISKMQELKSREESLERQIEYYRVENRSLQGEMERLKNDPDYLEKVAREKLKVAKEGEVVYKIENQEGER